MPEEILDDDFEQQEKPAGLMLTDKSVTYLNLLGKWAKVIARTGFVASLVCFIMGTILLLLPYFSPMGYERNLLLLLAGSSLYYFIGAVTIPPFIFLLRFGTRCQQAIAEQNSGLLEAAFKSLKANFTFCGIVILIVLSFYALSVAFSVLKPILQHLNLN